MQREGILAGPPGMGNQNKTVTIITNDPRKSKVILWVKGEVVKG